MSYLILIWQLFIAQKNFPVLWETYSIFYKNQMVRSKMLSISDSNGKQVKQTEVLQGAPISGVIWNQWFALQRLTLDICHSNLRYNT